MHIAQMRFEFVRKMSPFSYMITHPLVCMQDTDEIAMAQRKSPFATNCDSDEESSEVVGCPDNYNQAKKYLPRYPHKIKHTPHIQSDDKTAAAVYSSVQANMNVRSGRGSVNSDSHYPQLLSAEIGSLWRHAAA